MIRLDPGGRRVKSRIRTGSVAAFFQRKVHKKVYTITRAAWNQYHGSWGQPMGKRTTVQGRPFALVRAYAAYTHQCIRIALRGQIYTIATIV